MNFIVLIISSILAILAVTLRTERDKNDANKNIIKKLNKVGWVVIFLLVSAFSVQLIIAIQSEIDSEIAKDRELEKEAKIEFLVLQAEKDAANYRLQLNYLKHSYENQINLLTNTSNILNGTGTLLEQSQSINNDLLKSYEEILTIQDQDSINYEKNKVLSNSIFGSLQKSVLEQKEQYDSTIANLQLVENRLSKTTNNVERLTEKINLNDLEIVVDLFVKFEGDNLKINNLKRKIDSLDISMDEDFLSDISRKNKSFDIALNSEFNERKITGIIKDNVIKALIQERKTFQMAIYADDNQSKPSEFNALYNFELADLYCRFDLFSKETEINYFSGKDIFHIKLIFPKIEIYDQNLGSIISLADLKKSTIWIGLDFGENLRKLKLESVENLEITLRNGQYLYFEKQKSTTEGSELKVNPTKL